MHSLSYAWPNPTAMLFSTTLKHWKFFFFLKILFTENYYSEWISLTTDAIEAIIKTKLKLLMLSVAVVYKNSCSIKMNKKWREVQ